MGIRKETKHELFRAFSQLMFWGVIGCLIILLLHWKILGPTTPVNNSVECFIDERLNMWVYAIEAAALIIIAGLVAVFGTREYVAIVREEISRICYTLGAFTCVTFGALTFYYREVLGDSTSSHGLFYNYLFSPLCLLVFSGLGFCLYLWHSRGETT